MNKYRGLWRGKTKPKSNGEAFNNVWVEGDLILSRGSCYIHPIANRVNVQGELGRLVTMHEVDPSTLGECTGLTDKNDVKIFEGDIVKHYNHKDDLTRFDIGEVFWDEKHARFLRTAKDGNTYFLCEDALYPYEIIGNVYDNPQLLQAATGEDIGNAAQDTLLPAT